MNIHVISMAFLLEADANDFPALFLCLFYFIHLNQIRNRIKLTTTAEPTKTVFTEDSLQCLTHRMIQ